jgi:AsmA family protein
MNEKPSPQPCAKRWKWILGIAAIAVFSTTLAVFAVLSSIDFNTLKPLLTQFVKQETGRDLEIRGAIDFKLGFRPSLVMDDVVFQNGPWSSRREMVKIKRLEAKILLVPLLNREIQITRLALLEPDVLLETDKSGKWNFEFEKRETSPHHDTTSQGFSLPRMSFHEVQVQNGKVYYQEGGTGMRCCLSIDRFTAHSEGTESPIVLAFNGAYKDRPFELHGTVGSLLLLHEAGKAYPVDLTVKASGAQLRVEGTIQDMLNLKGLALKASAEVQSSSQIAAFFDETLPAEIGPLRASAAIADAEDKRFKLTDLKIMSRAGDAGGSLTVSLAGSRLKLSGSVASRHLNLKPFLNDEKTKHGTAEKAATKSRIFPTDPLPLGSLDRLDLNIKVRANQVQLPRLWLADLSTEVSVDEGCLALKRIKSKVAGGDAEGRVEVRHQGGAAIMTAVFKVDQMDLRQLSADLKAEGKAQVDLELLSRGSNIAELMAGLNGRTIVAIDKGKVDNKNIQVLGGDLGSGIFEHLNPSSKSAKHTDITCGVSGFDVKDGVANVTALVLDMADMTVIGEGQVNLRDETLDLSLKPYSKGGPAGFSLGLGELAKSFKLGGTLANPRLEIDTGQTMFAALKAAGGVLLFGPAGIVAALAGRCSGDCDPCLTALESARKVGRASENGNGREQKGADEKGTAGTLKGVGEGVKKFFMVQGSQSQRERGSDPYGGVGP